MDDGTTFREQQDAAKMLFSKLKEHRPEVLKVLMKRVEHIADRVKKEGPVCIVQAKSDEECEMLAADACILITMGISQILESKKGKP